MSISRSDALSDMLQRGSIRDSDVAQLAAELEADPHAGVAAVEHLLHLDAACHVQDPAWLAFLVETVTRFVVLEAEPRGYVNATKADWLIGRVTRNGRIERASVIELLLGVIASARWAPATLPALVLRQIAEAVRTGSGASRAGLALAPGQLTLAEITLARRVLLAHGRPAGLAVTGAEAAALLDIDAAQGPRERPDAWSELVLKALLSYAMGLSGLALATRAEALATGAAAAIAERYVPLTPEEGLLARLEAQRIAIITGETPPADEAERFAGRLAGTPSPAIDGLGALLARHCRTPHPALARLPGLARAA